MVDFSDGMRHDGVGYRQSETASGRDPNKHYLHLKRFFDITVALGAFVLVSPLLAFLALGVKATSSGPIFYQQERFGFGGKVFRILKFRTMYFDACDTTSSLQTYSGDPRITRFGRILRDWSFDELPQLWNVVRGDMSLVGPRPHPIGMRVRGELYADLVPDHHLRYTVKPGVTGLAQVSGSRGPVLSATDARKRHQLDLAYVESIGLKPDIWILVATLQREVAGLRPQSLRHQPAIMVEHAQATANRSA